MNSGPIQLIYLLGAGRSGTTLLATLLNAHNDITSLGEMHQFYDHIYKEKQCACGQLLVDCEFWGKVITTLSVSPNQSLELKNLSDRLEKHSRIPFNILGLVNNPAYDSAQATVFGEARKNIPSRWLLDSSKYIGRYLLLRKNSQIKIKGIYLVRDVRGVIHSFQKNVQTSRNPISALAYYSLINLFGQLVCWMDPKVIKIRYEDLVTETKNTLENILEHTFDNKTDEVPILDSYEMPHIIGGNRMKKKSTVKISIDLQWKQSMNRITQLTLALAALPTMLINKYRW